MISRKTFLKRGMSTLALALSGTWPALLPKASHAMASTPWTKQPNILMILTDQERSWADLPAGLDLPNRRAFANSATGFTRYYGNVVACGPSRSVIYTGQHIQKTGVYDNPGMAPGRNDLDPEKTPTLGAMLKDEGYRTGYIGKWHLSTLGKADHANLPDALHLFGFDEYQPAMPDGDTDGGGQGGYRFDPSIAQHVAKWLKEAGSAERGQPWFLAVNLINPHDVRYFDATGHQRDSLNPHFASDIMGLPDSPLYHTDLGYPLPATFPGPHPRPVPAHHLFVEDEKYLIGEVPLDNRPAWQRLQNYYFNCLRDVDRHIGTVLDSLETAGLADNTIVIFTSDHGEMGGAHGLRGKGPFLYKENFRLPLLIRHPGLPPGKTVDGLACSLDLAPTILAMAGVDNQTRKSRYPALKGNNLLSGQSTPETRTGILLMSDIVHCCNPSKKKHIMEFLSARDRGEKVQPLTFPKDFVNFNNRTFLRGIYDGHYKFGRYFSPNQHHTPRDWETLTRLNDLELYDTRDDPQETHDLATDPAYKNIILSLNNHLNRLLAAEAGSDRADFLPGGEQEWSLVQSGPDS